MSELYYTIVESVKQELVSPLEERVVRLENALAEIDKGNMIPESCQLKSVPTNTLVDELSGRMGVELITAEPHESYSIQTKAETRTDTGPAAILVIID